MQLMRRAAPPIAIILALAAPWRAMAEDGQRPRVTVVIQTAARHPPPAAPRPPALRKPLERLAPATVMSRRVSASPMLAALTIKGAVTPFRGLKGPSPSGAAAQCRAQCAERRYVCAAEDAGDCDAVWGECVVHCSGASYTRTPDLAWSAGYRPGP
jgi:hypothetical protein